MESPNKFIANLALARQRKRQIIGYFATQILYNCRLKLSSKDYKL